MIKKILSVLLVVSMLFSIMLVPVLAEEYPCWFSMVVYNDKNYNSSPDVGEFTKDIVVNFYDNTNTVKYMGKTDEYGNLYMELAPGEYRIQFVLPDELKYHSGYFNDYRNIEDYATVVTSNVIEVKYKADSSSQVMAYMALEKIGMAYIGGTVWNDVNNNRRMYPEGQEYIEFESGESPIPGAKVTVTNNEANTTEVFTTDEFGTFGLEAYPITSYTIEISMPGEYSDLSPVAPEDEKRSFVTKLGDESMEDFYFSETAGNNGSANGGSSGGNENPRGDENEDPWGNEFDDPSNDPNSGNNGSNSENTGSTSGEVTGTTHGGTGTTTTGDVTGTTQNGNDGSVNGNVTGTTTGGTDGTTTGGTDGTTPGGTDGTTPGGTDGTTPGGTDGTTPGGTDGTTPGGTDGTTPGGTDGATPDGTDGSGSTEEGKLIDSENGSSVSVKLNKSEHYAYVMGYPDGSIKPSANITREEVATIFFRLLTDETRDLCYTKTNKFADADANSWSNSAISTMANAGVIGGYPDNTFRPKNNITRAEFATIAAKFDSQSYIGPDRFTDISGHWAAEYINRAAMKGWISGYEDGTFKPDAYITRAEAMTLINNVLERRVSKENMLAEMKVWPDCRESDWFYCSVQEATNSHYYEKKDDTEVWTQLRENRNWAELER